MTGRVLSAGLFSGLGPTGPFMAFGVAGVTMALVVVGVNWWVRHQRSRQVSPYVDPNTVEASQAYRRFVTAATRANGSAWDWDHNVRPILGDVVERAMAELEPGGDPKQTARKRLGEPLWALVDRDARRSDDRSASGPGHHALQQILDQVEIT